MGLGKVAVRMAVVERRKNEHLKGILFSALHKLFGASLRFVRRIQLKRFRIPPLQSPQNTRLNLRWRIARFFLSSLENFSLKFIVSGFHYPFFLRYNSHVRFFFVTTILFYSCLPFLLVQSPCVTSNRVANFVVALGEWLKSWLCSEIWNSKL